MTQTWFSHGGLHKPKWISSNSPSFACGPGPVTVCSSTTEVEVNWQVCWWRSCFLPKCSLFSADELVHWLIFHVTQLCRKSINLKCTWGKLQSGQLKQKHLLCCWLSLHVRTRCHAALCSVWHKFLTRNWSRCLSDSGVNSVDTGTISLFRIMIALQKHKKHKM